MINGEAGGNLADLEGLEDQIIETQSFDIVSIISDQRNNIPNEIETNNDGFKISQVQFLLDKESKANEDKLKALISMRTVVDTQLHEIIDEKYFAKDEIEREKITEIASNAGVSSDNESSDIEVDHSKIFSRNIPQMKLFTEVMRSQDFTGSHSIRNSNLLQRSFSPEVYNHMVSENGFESSENQLENPTYVIPVDRRKISPMAKSENFSKKPHLLNIHRAANSDELLELPNAKKFEEIFGIQTSPKGVKMETKEIDIEPKENGLSFTPFSALEKVVMKFEEKSKGNEIDSKLFAFKTLRSYNSRIQILSLFQAYHLFRKRLLCLDFRAFSSAISKLKSNASLSTNHLLSETHIKVSNRQPAPSSRTTDSFHQNAIHFLLKNLLNFVKKRKYDGMIAILATNSLKIRSQRSINTYVGRDSLSVFGAQNQLEIGGSMRIVPNDQRLNSLTKSEAVRLYNTSSLRHTNVPLSKLAITNSSKREMESFFEQRLADNTLQDIEPFLNRAKKYDESYFSPSFIVHRNSPRKIPRSFEKLEAVMAMLCVKVHRILNTQKKESFFSLKNYSNKEDTYVSRLREIFIRVEIEQSIEIIKRIAKKLQLQRKVLRSVFFKIFDSQKKKSFLVVKTLLEWNNEIITKPKTIPYFSSSPKQSLVRIPNSNFPEKSKLQIGPEKSSPNFQISEQISPKGETHPNISLKVHQPPKEVDLLYASLEEEYMSKVISTRSIKF